MNEISWMSILWFLSLMRGIEYVLYIHFVVLSSDLSSNASIRDKGIHCITEFSVSLVSPFWSVFDANIQVVPEAAIQKEHNVTPNRPPAFGAWGLQSPTFLCLASEPWKLQLHLLCSWGRECRWDSGSFSYIFCALESVRLRDVKSNL